MISRMLDLVQQKVTDGGGKVVKSLGDGLVCQFGEVDAAFRAACEMQGAAAQLEPVEETDHKLAIKVVFTWGPVVTEGGDVFGDTVNVCARLEGIGQRRPGADHAARRWRRSRRSSGSTAGRCSRSACAGARVR